MLIEQAIRFPITFRRMSILAERLKMRRKELGLSQAQLAKRMSIRCSSSVIGLIEIGETRNPQYIVEIAQALGVSVNWLKGLTDDPTPEKITEKPIPPEYMAVINALREVEKTNPEQAAAWRRHLIGMADLVRAAKGEKTEE
ncbi:MAG TPA: helix-turn-helix transcriptional regulator [Azospirillaceae bacterium]|nr:helix-turn-helix transcriptional regulator [Azospirillaceae bacterium]